MRFTAIILSVGTIATLLASCGRSRGNDTGYEYAPDMYHSRAYEPYSQDDSNTINPMGMNMREPVAGTVKRQNYLGATASVSLTDTTKLLIYELHKDSIVLASRILKNPIPLDSAGQVLAQGKHLYTNFCSPCHGAEGKGDGKVGAGDTLYVCGAHSYDNAVLLTSSGSAGSVITIDGSYSGDTGSITFTVGTYPYMNFTGSYVTIKNLTINGYTGNACITTYHATGITQTNRVGRSHATIE